MKKFLAVVLCFCALLSVGVLSASAANRVYSLTIGIHKYSVNHTPSNGADIASISYFRHSDGTTGNKNRLFNVQPGEVFTVTTTVNADKADRYSFLGWLDINDNVISYSPTIEVTMDESKALFAAYAEVIDHHLIYYYSDGNGDLSVSTNRTASMGKNCVSVQTGTDVTFKLSPGKDNYVSYIKKDGRRVSMLFYSMDSAMASAVTGDVKGVFDSVVNYAKYCLKKDSTYVVKDVHNDFDVKVKYRETYFKK